MEEKMNRIISRLILAVFLLFGIYSASFAAPVLYQYQFKSNHALRYKIIATITGIIPVMNTIPDEDMHAILTVVYDAVPSKVVPGEQATIMFKVQSAEAEIEKIPFPIDPDQASQILNQTVTLSDSGKVLQWQPSGSMPFSITIPGIDPTRFFALLFPIVFPDHGIDPGESWPFKSEFLKGDSSDPDFTATLLPRMKSDLNGEQTDLDHDAFLAPAKNAPRFAESFQYIVDQKLNNARKPAAGPDDLYMTRKGDISGHGVFAFDKSRGVFTRGVMLLTAKINSTIVGTPTTPEEPKEMDSRVKARVEIALVEPAKPVKKPVHNKMNVRNKEKKVR
jgi:hypothetical protein